MKFLDVAFSPCPNDTFIFDGWVHGKITSPFQIKTHLADIQQLNIWAKEGKYPVTKVSAFCMKSIFSTYEMLPVGAAVSFHGPKLVARSLFDLKDLPKKIIAVPGMDTTAYLLVCDLFGKCADIISGRYEQIIDLVLSGRADVGVLIHETRFTFQRHTVVELADLGILFYEKYKLPIPLG
jgi:5,8-dihydroxy-2-naphthoate synthase